MPVAWVLSSFTAGIGHGSGSVAFGQEEVAHVRLLAPRPDCCDDRGVAVIVFLGRNPCAVVWVEVQKAAIVVPAKRRLVAGVLLGLVISS